MKKFLITVLAVIVGGIILAMLPFFMMVGVAASFGDDTVQIKPNTALVYNLETIVSDINNDDPMTEVMNRMYGIDQPSIGLSALIDNIDKAAVDPNINCIILEGSASGANHANMREIRNHLISFKNSGKPIYYYANSISQSGLYLGSVANHVSMTPEGLLDMMGVSAQNLYYKDLLDKLNIDMQIIRHGKFKSAIEPYMLNAMSDEAKLQTQLFVDAIWETLRDDIAAARNIDSKVIDSYVRDYNFYDLQKAVSLGLIDNLQYRDEFLAMVKNDLNIDPKENIASVSVKKYTTCPVYRPEKTFASRKIALINAVGEIYDGSNKMDEQNIYGDDLARSIRKARTDESIEAIVLRVNSPGGSAPASDVIWREVKLARETKPVIVSMGQYAASGGYYISCAADYIFAQPNTITGSIGVFGMVPCAKRAMDKVGIHSTSVTSHGESPLSYYNPLSPKQKSFYQNMVEKTYDTFVSRCADGRHTSKEHIDSIGQGRVWAGRDAIAIGLVDEIGSLDDAIAMAKAKVGIEGEANIVSFPEAQDPMTKMMRQMGLDTKASIGKMVFGESYNLVQKAQELSEKPSIKARLEQDIQVIF
ncbi:MAG: signal peptide peptidase SppA [Bacteroidia bacterium]|nr:signal peptide peptidase SppA [Bacteroidia bacterium]